MEVQVYALFFAELQGAWSHVKRQWHYFEQL